MLRTNLRTVWRGLWSHPKRTMLMISIVALASLAVILMWAFSDGFVLSMTAAQVRLDQGAVRVFAVGYRDDPVPVRGLNDDELATVRRAVAGLPDVDAAPRLLVSGLLRSAHGASGVEVRGVDPVEEQRVTTLHQRIREGRYLADRGEIVLGLALAEQLDIRVGERVVVIAQGEGGAQSFPFYVVGLWSSGLAPLDRRTVLIALPDARSLAGVGGATTVAIGLARGADPARADAFLTERLGPDFEVLTFREANPFIADMTAMAAFEMSIITFLLAILAGFGVASTAIFSVLERTQEFGVMLAMGMTPRRLSRMVVTESVLASTMGFATGAAIAYFPVVYLARVGIPIGDMARVVEGLGMPERVYASISGWYWLFSLSVVVVIGAVAALHPARRAARLQPVEAIRNIS